MRFAFVILIVVGVCAIPRAHAEHVDDVQAARDHYAKGKRLYDVGRFADAANEYEAAYQAKDDPALLFNLGQSYRLAGLPAKALLAYKAYLRNVPDAANRAEVEARVTELQAIVDRAPAPTPETAPSPKPVPQAAANALVAPAPPPPHRSIAHKPWFWAVLVGGAAVVAWRECAGACSVGTHPDGTCHQRCSEHEVHDFGCNQRR